MKLAQHLAFVESPYQPRSFGYEVLLRRDLHSFPKELADVSRYALQLNALSQCPIAINDMMLLQPTITCMSQTSPFPTIITPGNRGTKAYLAFTLPRGWPFRRAFIF